MYGHIVNGMPFLCLCD